MTEATTQPRTVDGEVARILAQLTAAQALIRSCEIAEISETVQRGLITMGEAMSRLETVSDRLSVATDLAMDLAKDTPTDAPAASLPEPLRQYLDDAQRAVYTLDSLLTGVVEVAYKNNQTDIEWSLRHIKELAMNVANTLDLVNVEKACEVES